MWSTHSRSRRGPSSGGEPHDGFSCLQRAPAGQELARERVGAAARDLHYRPNAVAASRGVHRTNTAIFIIPDITNPCCPELARGVQDVLRLDGYVTVISHTDERAADERALLEESVTRGLDGVVFAGFSVGLTERASYAVRGPAIVRVGSGSVERCVDSVTAAITRFYQEPESAVPCSSVDDPASKTWKS